jgi:putative drug exporter of the RND superfamily
VSDAFARLVVRARWLVVVAWVALAWATTSGLPSLREAQTGPLGDLVPVDAAALQAEQRSLELFALPLLSRTIVVERDPGGISAQRLVFLGRRVVDLNRDRLDGLQDARGGFLVSNHVGRPPLVRERGSTALVPLIFGTDVGPAGQLARGERMAAEHLRPAPPGAVLGVTGVLPARAAQGDLIEESLGVVELATLLVVVLIVGVYVRSVLAPLVALAAVAAAYLVAIRLIALGGRTLGISVPSEVEPIVVALLFGVVTDYVLFYGGRLKRRLRAGEEPRAATRAVTAELTPILLACGGAVAAACLALLSAELGFLRAFGPATAIAVLVGMLAALTLVPALLAILGRALLWPLRPERAAPPAPRQQALLTRVVRRPGRWALGTLAVLLALATPALWLELGNPVITGLPSSNGPHATYQEAAKGFAPGIVAPTQVVLEAPGILRDERPLRELGQVLGAQPGVAGVVGPGSVPLQQPFGVVRSPTGDAVRYVVVYDTDPLGADAVRRARNLKERLPGILELVGLGRARAAVAGDTALVAETIDTARRDLVRAVPVVLLAVLLVLVLFLRALVAPVYLVACATLAPLAATGLTVVAFQWLGSSDGVAFYVPIAAGVLLVALGSDYNVFLVGRVWAEARERPLREAIVAGGASASRAIAAAALVLAASFAATALVPVEAFRQLAFLVAVGLLLDGFVVRTVLVPAVIALVGERSAWPGRALTARYPAPLDVAEARAGGRLPGSRPPDMRADGPTPIHRV